MSNNSDKYVGKKFGKLLVVKFSRIVPTRTRLYLFRCDCGNEKELRIHNVTNGSTKSCGCIVSKPRLRHGHNKSVTEGPSRTYASWQAMWTRCTNKKRRDYPRYGGLGVSVCQRWKLFDNFLADMGVRPDGKTLDRIDPYGNYEPSNCRWATIFEQRNNWRKNKKSKEGGE